MAHRCFSSTLADDAGRQPISMHCARQRPYFIGRLLANDAIQACVPGSTNWKPPWKQRAAVWRPVRHRGHGFVAA